MRWRAFTCVMRRHACACCWMCVCLCVCGVSTQEGQFRWNRLDNLLREGSKSQDFDPGQLWLLAEWLLTPSATVRDTHMHTHARVRTRTWYVASLTPLWVRIDVAV